ncbi:MAG: ABC transporter substrate-binding protein [Polyangiaceae bacterium]
MRIVSLLPSATEIVCAVGAERELVGVSHECDFPEAVRSLPVLTSARIDARGTSQAIDAAVRTVIRDALSIYAVDERALADLAPDVIVTQDLCEVCAVSLDDVRAAVARLAHRESIAIVSLRPTRLADVWADIETVATALDRGPRGADVRATIESRARAIERRARLAPTRPRVVTIEWLDPIMLGGTWMPELIELAGGTALGARPGEPAPTVTLPELAALAPDVVLVKPCGFSIDRTLEERPLVDAIASAIPCSRLLISDGNAFFNRPGPRLLESLEILAACVHPAAFADFAEKHAGVMVR